MRSMRDYFAGQVGKRRLNVKRTWALSSVHMPFCPKGGYALSKRGVSQESISEFLGVSQSAVSRELRNRGGRGYRFKQAEAKL